MDSRNPGLVRHLDYLKQDAIIRTVMQHLMFIEDSIEDIRFSKDQIEQFFRKLLEHLDAVPIPSNLDGPAI